MDNPMVQELAQMLMDSANGYVDGTVSLEDHEHNASIWWAKAEGLNIDKEVAKILFNSLILKNYEQMKAMGEVDDISESIPELEEQ